MHRGRIKALFGATLSFGQYALGLATIGLLAGILLGTVLINMAVRSDRITIARQEEVTGDEDYDIAGSPGTTLRRLSSPIRRRARSPLSPGRSRWRSVWAGCSSNR